MTKTSDAMIQSMTGYGKSSVRLEQGTLTVEIRTLNAKGCDISIKSSLLPKDRELGIRQRIADALHRGTIDVYLNWEPTAGAGAARIDHAVAMEYWNQIRQLAAETGSPNIGLDSRAAAVTIDSVLRLPGVVDSAKSDVVTDENWPLVQTAFEECLQRVNDYRSREGEALWRDVTARVGNILALEDEVEAHDAERTEAVRARILKAAEELGVKLDAERFEQEMIFYLEKYDINEEKVRLRQHCKYFLDTLENEPQPGRKLGFIIQEMGREINTTGSKANHALIQKSVVRMKDELEKIREQSMNIL
ncbi:MAG: YicC family protein [Bacteroidales bacterium]|nr:YicC family protein [Bacteroidales bacterium]